MRSGSDVAVVPAALGERRALVEAEQRVGRLDLHLVEQVGRRLVLDDDRDVLEVSRKRAGIVSSASAHELAEPFAGHFRDVRGLRRRPAGRRLAPLAQDPRRPGPRPAGSSRTSSRTAQRSQSGFGLQMRRPWRMSVSDARVHASRRQALAQLLLDDLRDRRTRRGRSGWRRAARGDRPAARARRARGRARRSRSCGRRRAAARARPSAAAPRRRARSTSACAMPISARAFCRKNPVVWMSGSRSSGSAAASARGVRVAPEQRRRDHVHADVGGLRREDGRDEQLERIR